MTNTIMRNSHYYHTVVLTVEQLLDKLASVVNFADWESLWSKTITSVDTSK